MSNGSNNKVLELRSIYDLLGLNFIIPSYQRGYRWTKIEVERLLEDIWEFANKPTKMEGEFYCLQPIVVRKRNKNEYEVIDGQQRLTTIHIILSYLEKTLNEKLEESHKKSKFSIEYKTREKSKEFLENITNNDNNDQKNIDFYYMKEAYTNVKNWFDNMNDNDKYRFRSILLAQLEKVQNYPVVVIWYEIEDNSADVIDIFTRLNIGKIPLTNSELIKALLLKSSNFTDNVNLRQIQIATEWDIIEKNLQDDNFWYFIYNPSNPLKYDNRIEYILDLISGKKPDNEYYHTFFHFYNKLLNKKDNDNDNDNNIDTIWLEIKKYYLTLEEWYKDFELYHYIGFLISANVKILDIINEFNNKTKDKFKDWIKDKIKNIINCKKDEIDKLEYGDKEIRNILLLFNIQTIINSKNSDARFPFSKFKVVPWDVEHIRSRTDKKITDKNKQLLWINDILEYLTGLDNPDDNTINNLEDEAKKLCNDLKNYKEKENKNDKYFTKLFDIAKIYFEKNFKKKEQTKDKKEQTEDKKEQTEDKEEQTEDIDNISNLTLLDSDTNRSYGNAFFPIKRKKIIENDKSGKFVPIATKNLFLKYYSKKLDNLMYWTEDDANDYLEAIKSTLKDYLKD